MIFKILKLYSYVRGSIKYSRVANVELYVTTMFAQLS